MKICPIGHKKCQILNTKTCEKMRLAQIFTKVSTNLGLANIYKKHLKGFGWEPWSSGYGRRLVFRKVMGSNSSTIYWMDIFHMGLLYKL